MILMGSRSFSDGELLWRRIFDSFEVHEDDDVWARWLQAEFERRRSKPFSWELVGLEKPAQMIPDGERLSVLFPARQFVQDLQAVMEAKSSMTRRQWVSLIDAIVRVGCVSHTLWLCSVNERIWKYISIILGQSGPMLPRDPQGVLQTVLTSEKTYLSYGVPAMPLIRDHASRYLIARIGLNLVLWMLPAGKVQQLSSAKDIVALLDLVQDKRDELVNAGFWDSFNAIRDEEAKTIACKRGIGSNLSEFSRHTLGQRETASDTLRGYDQSYFLRRRSDSSKAPWVLSLGPVAVLALVHCCLNEVKGPRSVQRLSDHLSAYGIDVDVDDINSSDLGRSLRMLGLVLDSPDAETGMLLVPPFAMPKPAAQGVAR
jgi:hypothetical protein